MDHPRRIAAAFLLVAMTTSLGAFAKSVEDQVKELEKKLTSLQQTYLTNNQEVAAAVARAETLTRDEATLQGSIDTNRHLIDAQAQQLQKMFSDLDHRLQAIEERLHVFSVELQKGLMKVAPQAADEGKLYQAGLDKIGDANYLEAAAAFQIFLKKYPKSQFAPAAQYWIGESYFSVRDWKQAIKEYQKIIDKYPQHEKMKNALLNQGVAFVALGLTDEAKAFFEKVVKTAPTSNEATEARSRLDRLHQPASAPASPAPASGSYPEETLEEQRARSQTQPPALEF